MSVAANYAAGNLGGNDLSYTPGSSAYQYMNAANPRATVSGMTPQTMGSPYSNPVYSQSPAPTQSAPSGIPPLPPSLSPTPTPTPTLTPTPTPTPAPTTAPVSVPQVSPQTAQNALANFANSAGMQFALQQGANALNNLYAAHGQIQSGAAAKALQSFGQNTAIQQYFMPYMQMLQGQQAMGAQAASAISGVGSSYGGTVAGMGQNYANAATGINSGIGNALGQGAVNIGNAYGNQALMNGYANAGLGSAIGTGLGQVASSYFTPTTSGYSGGGGYTPTVNGIEVPV